MDDDKCWDGEENSREKRSKFQFLRFYELFDPTFPDKRLNQTVFSETDGRC